MGLEVGDRVEPSVSLHDWATIYKYEGLPAGGVRILFWRRRNNTICLHRNPIFDRGLGVEPSTMVVDSMHCEYLGVFQQIGAYALRAMTVSNVWKAPSSFTGEARLEHSLAGFKHDLDLWYRAKKREGRLQITEVTEVTTKMVVGSGGKPKLSLKAAETKWVMHFMSDAMTIHSNRVLAGPVWAQLLRKVVAHIAVMDSSPWRLSVPAWEECRNTKLRTTYPTILYSICREPIRN